MTTYYLSPVGGGANDSPAIQAKLIQIAADGGGVLELGPGTFQINTPISIGTCTLIRGSGKTNAVSSGDGTTLRCSTGASTSLIFSGGDGSGMSDLVVDGLGGMAAPSFLTQIDNTDGIAFYRVRWSNGYNGVWLKSGTALRFEQCEMKYFVGVQVVQIAGESDSNNVDGASFIECIIGAGTAPENEETIGVVLDGNAASVDFISTGIGFGGTYLLSTCRHESANNTVPQFIRIEGRGCENGKGHGLVFERGAHVWINHSYVSLDSGGIGIWQGSEFGDDFMIGSDVLVRGAGNDGLRLESPNGATVTGAQIVNNGSRNGVTLNDPLTAVTNAAGNFQITFEAPADLMLINNDRLRIQGVTSVPTLNGDFTATQVTFDSINSTYTTVLLGAPYASGFDPDHSDGTICRIGAVNIRLTGTSRDANIVGGRAGAAGSGLNRADYGVLNEDDAINNQVVDVDCRGNSVAPIKNGENSATVRFSGNMGMEQQDGILVGSVSGALAVNTIHDFSNMLLVAGQKLRVIRATGSVSAGSAGIRLFYNGSALNSSNFVVSATPSTATFATPLVMDAISGGPGVVQFRINSVSSSPQDLKIQFHYVVES